MASLNILKVERREDECCWVVEAIELALKPTKPWKAGWTQSVALRHSPFHFQAEIEYPPGCRGET